MKNYKYNNSVSEELSLGGYDFQIWENYHFIKIGATTVRQLKQARILPDVDYGKLSSLKPDCLIMEGKNRVIALVECKRNGVIKDKEKALDLISKYYQLAEKLGCKIICATDNISTYWISAKSEDIVKQNQQDIEYNININDFTTEYHSDITFAHFLDRLKTIDDNGNILLEETVLNPQKLADKVWQLIWVQTGKNPESCLYNVVEIFIFKFLSDLGLLSGYLSFDHVVEIIKNTSAEDGLIYYANNIRKHIKEKMFPAGQDGTTILNGTIFVNEKGEANKPQSDLFKQVIDQFDKYGKEEGPFINIDKNFKTRLYESFLRKEAGISAMGQYFTPRNVVKAMIDMCHDIPKNAKICDPFCGVGGFILEILNSKNTLKAQYNPRYDCIKPECEILGFDKGTDEKDDARTIILAKANMLIYFSDLMVKYPNLTREYSGIFNDTFHLLKTNGGTFLKYEYKDYFDFIFTNPPYVVKGVRSMKDLLKENGLNSKIYTSNGIGLEGLALDWIIYSLKPGGKAFVVLPTGIFRRLNDSRLRRHLMDTCYIDGVISLPEKTFYATIQKTYILAITKKTNPNDIQKDPVFTYIITEIGETRDSNRFPIAKNDLPNMAKQFKYFCR